MGQLRAAAHARGVSPACTSRPEPHASLRRVRESACEAEDELARGIIVSVATAPRVSGCAKDFVLARDDVPDEGALRTCEGYPGDAASDGQDGGDEDDGSDARAQGR